MKTLKKLVLIAAVLGFSSTWCAAQDGDPTSLVVCAGQSFTINSSSVATSDAGGSPEPTYQWLKGSAEIEGATSAAYECSEGIADAGEYSFTRVASAGTCTPATATPVVVKVVAKPGFPKVVAPAGVTEGGSAVFTVPDFLYKNEEDDLTEGGFDSEPVSNVADYTFHWTGDGGTASGNSFTFYDVSNGDLTASVYVEVNAGCTTLVASASVTASAPVKGSTFTFIDSRDSKQYKAVLMPDNKVWMAQNLNYTQGLVANANSKVANGAEFVTAGAGTFAIGSYWCPPKNGSTLSGTEGDCNIYGALYTWETAMSVDGVNWTHIGSSNAFSEGASSTTAEAKVNNANGSGRGICPLGWHMPTDFEWATLLDAVDGEGTGTAYRTQTNGGWAGTNDATGAGAKMKSAATHTDTDPGDGSWAGDNVGNNATGFGVVPAGSRANTGAQLNSRGGSVNYWSSSIGYSTAAWCRYFYSGYGHVSRSYEYRSYGFSVRCMKN